MFDVKKEVLFDEVNHIYTDPSDNAAIPSTTRIMSLLDLSGDYSSVPNIQWYADRGTLTHYALEMYAQTGDKETAVELAKAKASEIARASFKRMTAEGTELKFKEALWKDAEGYFESGVKFITDNSVVILDTEKQFLNNIEGRRYAGTIDVVAELNGAKYPIDWKTSKDCEKESYYLQLGAYAEKLDTNAGGIIRLHEDGSVADIITVDILKYRDRFRKLLEIFYDAELTDEAKRAKAKSVCFDSVQLDKEKAVKLASLDAEAKRIKKEMDDLREEIQSSLNEQSGFYEDDAVKVGLTFTPGTESDDVDYSSIAEELKNHLLTLAFSVDKINQIYRNNTTKKTRAGSYRLSVKVFEGPKVNSRPKKTREKKEKAAIDATPEPVKQEPVKEPVKQEAPVTEAPAENPFKTGRPGMKEVELVLKSKGFSEALIEMFWVNCEGLNQLRRDCDEFDMAFALELAKTSTKEILEQYLKDSKEGKIL